MFEEYHSVNPHVFELILKISRDLIRRGHKRSAIAFIFERIRWLYTIQTVGDEFKLNNNYKPFYARKVMREAPDLDGFFEIRSGRHHANE